MKHYKIKFGTNERDASEYQDIIMNEIEHGSSSMVISAAAGSGKTTTMVNCISLIDPSMKILFIAFNKDIVTAIEAKIQGYDNVRVMTYHSLGMHMLMEAFPDMYSHDTEYINESKYRIYLKEHINELSTYVRTHKLNKSQYESYVNNVTHLVDYSRYYLIMKERDIKARAEFYGMNLMGDEAAVCRLLLEWGKEHRETLDYCDMIWLPNVLNLATRRYLSDFIFIDEAQDTTIAQKDLVCRTFKRGSRFLAVGDEKQQINLWCGASEEAIDSFKKMKNVKTLSLPISYRCPKRVIRFVQEMSSDIKAADNAIEGCIRYDVKDTNPNAGDMVLCRNTAPLIELSLKYLRINKQFVFKGCKQMKKTYLDMIRACDSTYIDREMSTYDGLIPQLYRNMFDAQERLMQQYGLDEDDSLMQSQILQMNDNIESIKVLSEGLLMTNELIKKIEEVFTTDDGDGVILSTVHKAKGLEANNVFILRPSLLPSKLAKKDWELRTETNLTYVAYTRPKVSLNFIEEPQLNKWSGIVGATALRNQLKGIKDKITDARKNNLTAETIYDNIQPFNNESLKVPFANPLARSFDQKKDNKKKAGLKFSDMLD